jgi:hypothetical protein
VGVIAEIVLNAVAQLFFGMAPERPLWLRRTVQAFWILLGALLLAAFVSAIAALVTVAAAISPH